MINTYSDNVSDEEIDIELYKQLFEYMNDGFALHRVITDNEGNPIDYQFLKINKAFERLTGLKSEDIVRKTVLEVLPQTEKYWIETYGKVALTGIPISFYNFSKQLNKYYEVKAYSPHPLYFAVIFIDVTENIMERDKQRKAERDYLRNAKWATLGQLVAGVSHEINNPLTIVKSYMELIETELDRKDIVLENELGSFDKIHAAIDRIHSIVKMLRSYAKSNVNIQNISVNQQLVVMLDFLSIMVRKGTTKIALDLSKDDLIIKGNYEAFQQVIANLVSNAFEATEKSLRKSKNIIIKTFLKDDVVHIEVSDNGIGIPSDLLERVFDPFYTTKEVGKGIGMGLPIAQTYVRDMGGDITVESVVGEGAKFYVTFPLVKAEI